MEKKGPFVVMEFDSHGGSYYGIHPIEEHTHASYEQARHDAESELAMIQEDQPEADAGELQDRLIIQDIDGNFYPYP